MRLGTGLTTGKRRLLESLVTPTPPIKTHADAHIYTNQVLHKSRRIQRVYDFFRHFRQASALRKARSALSKMIFLTFSGAVSGMFL
jgi:hypothetical protein